ncbi:nuclear pore complex protein Nup50 [Lucilia sericata]|uniref:nuclear pore complex protein Nup50 n=1 Tax=Lucilia sericata TaxID=13632 RepID=UPI0018A87CA4|nr:nuclear pore complex protein Nup50 [Lucilia sericata]
MAGKRQATSDLNHDNWDREEEPEDRGTFRTASEDELKNRVIKKAKRKIAPASGSDAADGGSGTKSVFSGFAGFGKPASTAATTGSASPFSFLSKLPAAAATSTPTSSAVSSSTTTANATPTFSFGTATATASKTTESSKAASTFSFGNTNVSATTTAASKTSTTTASESSPFSFSSSSEYYKKLSSLNQAVSEWVKTHVDKNPVCILSPIFKDYEKYLKEIEDEKKKEATKGSTTDATEKPASTPSTGIGSFKFSSSSSSTTSATSTTTDTAAKTNGFSFGLKKTEETSPAKPATPATTFSFGLKPSTSETSTTTATSSSTTTPSSGFSFGNLSNTTNQSSTAPKPFSFTPTPFSFGNIKPPAAASDTTAAANEDEDEEPPKNEFKQVVEDDAVYSKKCKVFVKKDGNFVDKGVGTLYLKPVESSEKTQLIVRADTNLGNILVNLILNSAIPAQRMGKNNVMMVCLPTPDVEKPTSMLLRVKTAEEADELLENIDKYKK